MAKPINTTGDLTGMWIYWRYKDNNSKALSCNRVKKHLISSDILELSYDFNFDGILVNKDEIEIFMIEDVDGKDVSEKFKEPASMFEAYFAAN